MRIFVLLCCCALIAAALGGLPISAAASTRPILAADGPDPAAARPGWEIAVTQAGMQVLSSAGLRAAGLDPDSLAVGRLQLTLAGTPIALEEIRSNGSLRELRFYAPPPANRYDPYDRYWLTLEDSAGLRMRTRDARPGSETPRSTGRALGRWYAPVSYESRLAGPDGDHFFSADLRSVPAGGGEPGLSGVISLSLTLPLPPAAGETIVDLDGSSLFDGEHTLSLTLANTTRSAVWLSSADWAFQMRFPTLPNSATLALLPRSTPDGVHVNALRWTAPVDLRFGGNGAAFFGASGTWAYSLRETPSDAALYDLSDPANPQRLIVTRSGEQISFRATAAQPTPYLLSGPGSSFTPPIVARQARDLTTLAPAEAIYLAPQAWLSELEPLLALRQAQGRTVIALPVEAIYAGWSGGQVRPEAIRAFLQYVTSIWSRPPSAITLVGDGSSDPYDYFDTGRPSWIPPYLLPVDPWIGETACEHCYVQLDGSDPLSDLRPELAIGRLPVKSSEELAQLIVKIDGYERSQAPGRWRARVAYIADNADLAGDFAAIADRSAADLPAGVERRRVYYDPDAAPEQPWRIRDPLAATAATQATLSNGAGVLVYLGHGLQFQWAFTGPPLEPSDQPAPQYLLNVDSARDTRNQLRLPIILTMTCLSSAFQTPSFRGTTIDEALLLHNEGGAIAVIGSSGQGVLYGHEELMQGFFGALWSEPTATLGELTLAAYDHLLATANNAEAIRTFIVLGDPLTLPQISSDAAATLELNLPIVRR